MPTQRAVSSEHGVSNAKGTDTRGICIAQGAMGWEGFVLIGGRKEGHHVL